ncbi:MAG: nrdG [Haloplasmataceae bacterium]|jgi:anaerobic ribonucleoside-triphosphate reductase activating protein|nr:nrdG [Haloplasmataceae bacterium]
MKIRIAGIEEESIVDGPGIRYTIFTQGCYHNCLGCHNQKTHDVFGGYLKEINEILFEIKKYPLLSGITISGGEPFLQINECFELISGLEQKLDIIVYTGYTFESLLNKSINNATLLNLLNRIDYLIDGKFEISLRDLDLEFRGSSNQRIINVKESLLTNTIITKTF